MDHLEHDESAEATGSAEHPAPFQHDHESREGAPADPLLAIRAELDQVDQLPLEQRAEVFERTHRIVTDELRALELG